MKEKNIQKLLQWMFYLSMAFIIYMPLHVFIVQSASLLTGGLGQWKAAKDVVLVVIMPLLLYLSYARGLFKNKTFRLLMVVGGLYVLLHTLFVLFDTHDDTYSAIVGSAYNTRLLGYLLLGYVVGSAKKGRTYLKYLLTAAIIIATLVAVFGVAQYFFPSDLLTHVGYTLDRGVKYMFFIDDKPSLPRVMSTLKDPNSFGAYLVLPILITGYAFFSNKVNKSLFIRPFKKNVLFIALFFQIIALLLTFSRGALIALLLASVTMLGAVKGRQAIEYLKNHWIAAVAVLILVSSALMLVRNTFLFQNVVFHADKSTVLADPNEKRVTLARQAIDDIVVAPLGHSPCPAGLVSIKNPKGCLLTENYYLQIAYEVGWLGLALFIAILYVVFRQLFLTSHLSFFATVMLSSMLGYLFYSLLIHLWSNESVALQWWLLAGTVLGMSLSRKNQ